MLQPPDIVVLFAISDVGPDWTLRSLGDRLGVKHSKVQRAVGRLEEAGLYDARRRRVVPHATEEFLLHGLRYMHPLREGPIVRGVPTAWGALPLRDEIVTADPPPVWPDPRGSVRGPAVEPLDQWLPALANKWPRVAEFAALVDALRLGDARTRDAAARHLRERLRPAA